MISISKLPPFKRFCVTIGAIPATYIESLSYYETLLWLCKYLQDTVIPAINNNAEAVREIQEWIENINIEEYVNSKLDEMADDGTLENLINPYLSNKYKKAIVSYDTISEMVSDESIEEGQTIYVKGNITMGDGFSAYYNITDEGTVNGLYVIKLDNDLYAIMQNELESNFYDEIYTETIRTDYTDIYLTYIPYQDNNNEQINLVVNPCGTNPITNTSFSPNEHARYYNTTLTTNASLAIQIDNQYVDGIVISNGTIIRDYSMAGVLTNEYKYIGIKEDRTISSYQANSTTAQAMINDGVKNAVLTFGTCVENGNLVDNFAHSNTNDANMFLGIKNNKDIIILACDGRNSANLGIDYETAGQLLIDKGCITVFCIDSGGSTSINLKGTKINMNIDGNGTNDRKISYLFDVKKTITNKETADLYSYIGYVKNNINKQLTQLINKRQPKILLSKYNFTGQTIDNTIGSPTLINTYSLSSPSSNFIDITNGEISLDLPEQYESLLPYQIKIHGHVILENSTNSNTSLILTITEDGTTASTYRETIGSNDFATFTIDEIFNNVSASRKYKLYLGANANGTIKVNGGTLIIEYIPKITSFID